LGLRLAEVSDQDALVYAGIYDGSSVVVRLPLDVSAETDGSHWCVVLTVGESVSAGG
jgi:hypothetical protein